jgi:AcrR family transcriptional regulator
MPLPERRQRLAHDERRRQILDCARGLFSERSYDSVSTAEIAAQAGVARGLLHHYFGTKRELYLEVVRGLVRLPANPVPRERAGRGLEELIEESTERWLGELERNRGTWLAAVGTRGLGRDPEVAEILNRARERTAARIIRALEIEEPADAPPELWAAVRSWGALAEAASVEWLGHRRIDREQAKVLVVRSFLALVREVLPALPH